MHKNQFKRKAIFILMLLSKIVTQAQNDSISIVSQQFDNDNYYNLKYESLDMFLRDETRIFKISVSPFKPNEKYDFSIFLSQLAYERKLNKTWSAIAELNQEFMFLKDGNFFINTFDLGIRNYFLKSKQIQNRVSGDNCNGPYIGAKLSKIIDASILSTNATNDRYVGFNPTPEVNIGITAHQQSILCRCQYFC